MNTLKSNDGNDFVALLQAQNAELMSENQKLKTELSDLNLMYDYLMQHGEAIEDQLAERNQELEVIQKNLVSELNEAARYVLSIIPEPLNGEISTRWIFAPSSQLGGDSFGYHWIDDEHLGIYLLDVCGHGVGAALLSVTVINVIRSGALSNTDFLDPGQVLTSLNNAFDMTKHHGMYFTFWYGVFNKSTREMCYASGGHPPAILTSHDGTVVETLSTPNMVVGGFPYTQYKAKTCVIPAKARLFIFSDGVYEIFKPDGQILTYNEFVKLLTKINRESNNVLEDLIAFIKQMQNSEEFNDDFSLLQVNL